MQRPPPGKPNRDPPAPQEAPRIARSDTGTLPIVIPVRPPARGAGGRSVTAERPAFVPPAAPAEREPAQLAQLANVRQARLDRMAMRSVPSDPERTELAVKSLKGM